MSNPQTISIDDVLYVRADSVPAGDPPPVRIVVADRGWVFVGHVVEDDEGILISNAKCIRYWGTDEKNPGLGHLAANGPTSKTKLDPSGTVRIPRHAIMLTLDAKQEHWA